jgi:hypothetical protein
VEGIEEAQIDSFVVIVFLSSRSLAIIDISTFPVDLGSGVSTTSKGLPASSDVQHNMSVL